MIIINCLLMPYLYSTNSSGQTPSNDPHWQLIWQDDFNFFDTGKWVKANYAIHGENENLEPQLYMQSNVSTSNGQLIIKVNNNQVTCPLNPTQTTWACGICTPGQTFNFTSGWVETNHNYNTQFGFIEARISLPYGHGFWPAFWTWRGSGVNTFNEAEIDIFEVYGHKPPDEYGTNVHLSYNPNPINFPSDLLLTSYADVYHIYGVEWSPTKITWFIDGYPVRLLPNPGVLDPVRTIFNLAIQPGHYPNGSTPFPSEMKVDYFKVYEWVSDCNDYINSSNYDFSEYDNTVKSFIKIGDMGSENIIAHDVIIRASDYIEIGGEFEIPLGTSFYADVSGNCDTQLSTECTQTFNPCNYDFTQFDGSTKRKIHLGGVGCNATIAPTSEAVLLQSIEYIELKEGVHLLPSSIGSVELKIVSCP